MGSKLRGEEALLFAEKMGVEVVASGVLVVSAKRAREIIAKAPSTDRPMLLAGMTVEVKEPARERAA